MAQYAPHVARGRTAVVFAPKGQGGLLRIGETAKSARNNALEYAAAYEARVTGCEVAKELEALPQARSESETTRATASFMKASERGTGWGTNGKAERRFQTTDKRRRGKRRSA